jgi:hypothetical protein
MHRATRSVLPTASSPPKEVSPNRTIRHGVGSALALALISVVLLPGAASATETPTTPAAPCDTGDLCLYSEDGKQQLTFDQSHGTAVDLFRYWPGPGPNGSWTNGVYRLINRMSVPVKIQDIDTGLPTIIGEVAPEQDVSEPALPLKMADRILLIS